MTDSPQAPLLQRVSSTMRAGVRRADQHMDELREWVRKRPAVAKLVYSVAHPEWNLANRAVWRVSPESPGLFDWAELRHLRRVPDIRESTPATGPSTLFCNLMHGGVNAGLELMLAKAISLAGANVRIATIDQPLPSLDRLGFFVQAKSSYRRRSARALGLPTIDLGCWLQSEVVGPPDQRSIAQLLTHETDSIPLGQIAADTLRWAWRLENLDAEPQARDRLSALVMDADRIVAAMRRLLDEVRPDKLVLFNGNFLTERVLFELARARELEVICFERGWRPATISLTRNALGACWQDAEGWAARRDLDVEERQRISEYLEQRSGGNIGSTPLWPKLEEGEAPILNTLGLAPGTGLAVLFTNIVWDTAVLNRNVGFRSMLDWISHCIEWFRGRQEVLVIRAHPAEIRLSGKRTKERVREAIAARIGELPDNVRFVGNDSPISSYSLLRMARATLVYTSTLGMESAAFGREAIVAGETHYRGLGFTTDVAGAEELNEALERAMQRCGLDHDVSAERAEGARKYMHFLLFQHMLEFPMVEVGPAFRPRYLLQTLADFEPPKGSDFEVIIDAILRGGPVSRSTS